VAAVVLEYYALLRSLLREQPELRRHLVRCRHCGIFFLTDPRNGKRRDLGCPFGCAEAHRKASVNRRSLEHYQGPEARRKKSALNQRRRLAAKKVGPGPSVIGPAPPTPILTVSFVRYVCRVMSWIEHREVTAGEVRERLGSEKRQHRMGKRGGVRDNAPRCDEHPP
jgi:hypothetical protein